MSYQSRSGRSGVFLGRASEGRGSVHARKTAVEEGLLWRGPPDGLRRAR